ncbi:MAG: hypothetical protein J6X02_02410 [Bacilli bacterium]|nr:hypothetical protein [Bacilli bacterium]
MFTNNLKEENEIIIPRLYPSKAKKDIKEVNDAIIDIQNAYSLAVKDYFNTLYKTWTSPRALEFYGKAKPILVDIDSKIIDFNETTIRGLISSFNRIAPSHRESYIGVSTGPYTKIDIDKLLEIGPNGIVGMVENEVGVATHTFNSKLLSIKNKVSAIPSKISFYDTNGHLAGSGDTKVGELRSLLDRSIDRIIVNIIADANDAIMKTRQGTAVAVETLSSK